MKNITQARSPYAATKPQKESAEEEEDEKEEGVVCMEGGAGCEGRFQGTSQQPSSTNATMTLLRRKRQGPLSWRAYI
jgi:hypothetical protein